MSRKHIVDWVPPYYALHLPGPSDNKSSDEEFLDTLLEIDPALIRTPIRKKRKRRRVYKYRYRGNDGLAKSAKTEEAKVDEKAAPRQALINSRPDGTNGTGDGSNEQPIPGGPSHNPNPDAGMADSAPARPLPTQLLKDESTKTKNMPDSHAINSPIRQDSFSYLDLMLNDEVM